MAAELKKKSTKLEVILSGLKGMVRGDNPDLTARQLGVLITCYTQDGQHTVRGLAEEFNVSKPAITRALDRLGEFGFVRRKIDPMDRRSVFVVRTAKGSDFIRNLEIWGAGHEAEPKQFKRVATPHVVEYVPVKVRRPAARASARLAAS